MRYFIQHFGAFKKALLIFVLAECIGLTPATASPGDTTWVTVFNQQQLTHYGNYDTTAVFPTGKRYRKIRMHYILGRYACPAGSQYCGSWDYTTQIYAMPTGKDSAEIARIITPYASDWLTQNKSHDYIVEVTDFSTLLDGQTGMRFNYSGYSWGFTITLKFEMIEGVPPMDALSVSKVYDGYFPYGQPGNSIENYLTQKTFSFTAPTDRVFLKNVVSGHGSDNNGCSEFCSRYYTLNVDGSQVSQKQLLRSDCGVNNVYPQTGTWIYERGNWCPGAVVHPIYHDLSTVTSANTTFSLDIDMQPYTKVGANQPGYFYGSNLIHYSAPNHTRDVSIEDILAPTKDANYARSNPRCSNPIIRIKNTGTDTVTSVVFDYGLKGQQTPLTHTWTGSLAFLEETEVVFPPSSSILTSNTSTVFNVALTHVNTIAGDNNSFNNIYTATTTPVSVWPNGFVIKLTTNNMGDNSWMLMDENDNVLLYQANLMPNTVYLDTVWFLNPGCYRIFLEDAGCDGLSWWANPSQGAAQLRIDPLSGFTPIYNFPTDIGCNYNKYFSIANTNTVTVGVADNNKREEAVEVYPNPAQTTAFIRLDLNKDQTVRYELRDLTGKLILSNTLRKSSLSIEPVDISSVNNGVYMMTITLEDHSVITRKLVIGK